ncbi:hypothetical protein L596_022071 [Steinernema carpocapsae]|uniref:Uncharacterized protein n=1 Tax=Steinernema carpocapsae TaxID=34508 RepID=A0A4U5ML02_STECR|nr:hypothetical protein L596_022071 [Steinernema carpocapsae]
MEIAERPVGLALSVNETDRSFPANELDMTTLRDFKTCLCPRRIRYTFTSQAFKPDTQYVNTVRSVLNVSVNRLCFETFLVLFSGSRLLKNMQKQGERVACTKTFPAV